MNSDLQREAFSVLEEVRELAPDIRLGQLFAHLGFLGEVHLGKGLGDIEDDELVAILYRHRAELTHRAAEADQGVTSHVSVSGSPTVASNSSPRN